MNYYQLMLVNLWGHLIYFLSDFSVYLVILLLSTILFFFLLLKIYKANFSQHKKNILLAILFTFLSFVYVYSAGEFYFRYRYDTSDGLGFLQTNERWTQRHVQFNNINYRDNKDFTTLRQNGLVKIGVIGDSLAFGQGIKDVNNRFSNLLETKLRKNGYNVEVYNFGIPGLDTCGEMQQFSKINYIPMDLIVWSYYFNDIEPCDYSLNAGSKILKDATNNANPLRVELSKFSFLFDFLYWRFSTMHDAIYNQLRNVDLAQYSNKKILNMHLRDIASFSAQLKNDGNTNNTPRKVVAIFFPLLNVWSPQKYPGTIVEKEITKVFASKGIPVVDMLPAYQGKQQSQLTVNRFDAHPNEYVHAIAADKLYNVVTSLLEKTSKGTFVKK